MAAPLAGTCRQVLLCWYVKWAVFFEANGIVKSDECRGPTGDKWTTNLFQAADANTNFEELYSAQLEQLASMGFTNRTQNIAGLSQLLCSNNIKPYEPVSVIWMEPLNVFWTLRESLRVNSSYPNLPRSNILLTYSPASLLSSLWSCVYLTHHSPLFIHIRLCTRKKKWR